MKKVLLLGATGYVGSDFSKLLSERFYEVIRIGRSELEGRSISELVDSWGSHAADFLINSAGYTGKPNVDACELDKANCLHGNAVLPGTISKVCQQLGLRWGHVSSGCIFTGRRGDGGGFTELDSPNFSFRQNNCSFYSGTKALGEEILRDDPSCFVWRLRIPFSNLDSPRNYLSKVMRYDTLLEAENSLSYLPEFVSACIDCFSLNAAPGIYNVTNPGAVKTSEVAQMIQNAGLTKKEFRFFETEERFMALAAKTPRSNCVMDSSKALAAGLKLRPIEEVLRESLANWCVEGASHVLST